MPLLARVFLRFFTSPPKSPRLPHRLQALGVARVPHGQFPALSLRFNLTAFSCSGQIHLCDSSVHVTSCLPVSAECPSCASAVTLLGFRWNSGAFPVKHSLTSSFFRLGPSATLGRCFMGTFLGAIRRYEEEVKSRPGARDAFGGLQPAPCPDGTHWALVVCCRLSWGPVYVPPQHPALQLVSK